MLSLYDVDGIMSARNLNLRGFEDLGPCLRSAAKLFPGAFSQLLLKSLIQLTSKFNVDPAESLNALRLMSITQSFTDAGVPETPSEMLFLICLRLSIFHRKRRDILSDDHAFAMSVMKEAGYDFEKVQQVEAQLFRAT